MVSNVGSVDRVVRVVVGLAILSGFFWIGGSARWFALIGIVPLMTAATRFCPLYRVLGVSTCAAPKKGA